MNRSSLTSSRDRGLDDLKDDTFEVFGDIWKKEIKFIREGFTLPLFSMKAELHSWNYLKCVPLLKFPVVACGKRNNYETLYYPFIRKNNPRHSEKTNLQATSD